MDSPRDISRIILVVLDGLRADSIPLFPLPHLSALAKRGAATFAARTIHPSITSAAMTSLFTGVSPAVHGVDTDGFRMPRPRQPLTFLPHLLRDHGFAVHGFMHAVPRTFRGLGARMAEWLGADVTFSGQTADEILDEAMLVLEARRKGVVFVHWPDADRAGHAHGWTSGEYAAAARAMDAALQRLVVETDVPNDPETVLIAFADHGGGGRDPRDHDSTHPLDTTIPVIMAGGQVDIGELAPLTSLLDIPATVAWALGMPQPASYAGRPLIEAFKLPAAGIRIPAGASA